MPDDEGKNARAFQCSGVLTNLINEIIINLVCIYIYIIIIN